MNKTFLKFWLIIGILHFVLLFGLFFYGFDLSPIDTGIPSPASKVISMKVAGFLMMPMMALWNQWMSENLPNSLEWLFVFLNSALWGAVGAFIISYFLSLKRNKNAVKSSDAVT
jgi:hypothetical protein